MGWARARCRLELRISCLQRKTWLWCGFGSCGAVVIRAKPQACVTFHCYHTIQRHSHTTSYLPTYLGEREHVVAHQPPTDVISFNAKHFNFFRDSSSDLVTTVAITETRCFYF